VGSRLVPAAIVSPTDPLAAATIMRGRFDDATAFVAYRVVVATVVAGSNPRRSTIGALTLLWPSSREARFGVETFSCGNKIRTQEN
jgi:NhaP-type Na+/H+ or K+/H+ antiporter